MTAHAPERSTTTTARPVTLSGAVRSEWIKFRGLASNLIVIGVTFVLLAGNGAAMAWAYVFRDRASARADYDAFPEMVLDKTGYVGIVLAVLAALLVANEYRSGQIKTTLLAVPRRTPVLLGKAAVIAAVSFLVGVVSALIGFAVAPGILASGGYGYDLPVPELLRLVLGNGLYLATLSVIGIAMGAIIRNVVASVLSVLALLLIVPIIPQMFSAVGTRITAFFPIQAGSLVVAPLDPESLGPWLGYLVLVIWAAVSFAVAVIVLRRRDA